MTSQSSLNGWVHTPGEKFSWVKGEHYIKIKPTDSRKPRGSKTIWLVENKRIGSKSVRLGYADTYEDAIGVASQYMKRW